MLGMEKYFLFGCFVALFRYVLLLFSLVFYFLVSCLSFRFIVRISTMTCVSISTICSILFLFLVHCCAKTPRISTYFSFFIFLPLPHLFFALLFYFTKFKTLNWKQYKTHRSYQLFENVFSLVARFFASHEFIASKRTSEAFFFCLFFCSILPALDVRFMISLCNGFHMYGMVHARQ